ncbi:universal stress protein [Aquimarina sp. RZ0]|uniref:universal stress protein n=1 Tax=Aquimarina sp. RZ0 TaxID=2607730 RepID=UPI0011F2A165|nr:universal stress protein [Aquimarina sp. RZ0]KAA1246394.1 universal stress protein [Aquimarina sp. RZ0]
MNTIEKILIPFDLSTTSEYALRFALSLFSIDYKPDIVIIHSYNSSNRDKIVIQLESKIEKIKSEFQYAKASTIELVIKPDFLIDTILVEQQEREADLIIMGTKGCDIDDESIFSNTSELVLEADCPVLVIPETILKDGIHKIALVLGKEEIDDPSVLMTLLILARHFKAKVYVLTIVNKDDSYGYTAADQKNENTVEYYLENFYSQHVFRESDDVEQGIFDFVANNKIDMVTILPYNHAKRHEPSEGRLTKLLALHTQVPLLTLD